MRCVEGMSVIAQDYEDEQLRAHSRVHQVCHVIVRFHVLCVDLGFHVVIGVGRLTVQREGFIHQLNFTTHTQFYLQSSFLLDVVVRLCPVIVNSNCTPNSCMCHIAKMGPFYPIPISLPMHRLIGGSRVSYQDTKHNLKRRRPLCAED